MSTKGSFFWVLSKLTKEISQTEELDKIPHLIVSAAVEALKGKAAVIFLRDEEKENFISNKPVAQMGLSEKYVHAGAAHAIKMSPQLL